MDCKSLEDVFVKFNMNHPTGYKARSLSVSDVVEVVADEKVKPGFYFCDSIGYQSVAFDPEKTQISDRFCDAIRLIKSMSFWSDPVKPLRWSRSRTPLRSCRAWSG